MKPGLVLPLLLTLFGCAAQSVGLAPIYPKHDTKIATNSLVLEWEASTEPAEEVRYQLVIFRGEDIQVYEATDLQEPRNTVNADLAEGEYQWTVRALHLRSGDWVPGPWSHRKYFYFAVVVFGWGSEQYRFKLLEPIHHAPMPTADVEPTQPVVYAYRLVDGDSLLAYVFNPAARAEGKPANAILLFHGGGWSAGSPEWTFPAADRFASYGLVAIAIEYRLSGPDATPVDALDDVCYAFAWTREFATELGVADKVAGYGVSAGGQLVAAAATIGCGTDPARPDALLLWSPAVDVAEDGWFATLLQDRGKPVAYSPVDYVTASTPPTCIVQGAKDTLTPLSGAQRFCDRLVEAGGVCELNVYEGVGHLLTRNLADQEENYDPDPAARADGIEKQRRFLVRLGLVADRTKEE